MKTRLPLTPREREAVRQYEAYDDAKQRLFRLRNRQYAGERGLEREIARIGGGPGFPRDIDAMRSAIKKGYDWTRGRKIRVHRDPDIPHRSYQPSVVAVLKRLIQS